MSKIAYFDCFSGVSGDMLLGALLDVGLPIEALRGAIGSLAIDYTIRVERVVRAGFAAAKFTASAVGEPALAAAVQHAHHDHEHHDHEHGHGHHADHAHGESAERREASHGAHHHEHHTLAEIARKIDRSSLSAAGRDRAIRLFGRLAEAEAAVHDTTIDRVHLHEVGALDSIIDIVGAVYGMEWLGVNEIVSSPLNLGSGTVRCAHGVLPVPAPATARLLRGVPVYAGETAAELVTPTGALLVTEYAKRFGTMPQMCIDRIGYGAGDRDFPDRPNMFRLILGDTDAPAGLERIVVIECEIDDMNPQLFGPLMDRLYADGALDVFYAPVQMKKNRPGTLVTVIAPPARREALAATLFAETTTIGVRYHEVVRERLEREVQTIDTPVGPIRFKVAARDGRVMNAAPEFDDCAKAAVERGLPIKDVQAIAVKAWLDTH